MAAIPVTVTVTDKNGQQAPSVGGAVTLGSSSSMAQVGETSILPINDSGNGNLLIAQPITLTQAGIIQSLSFYVTTVGGQLRLGIYGNNAGNPGNKLAETNAFTPVAGWNTANVTSSLTMQPGTYWIAYLPQSNTLGFRNTQSGGPIKLKAFTFGSLPTVFPSGPSSQNAHFSFYATFQEGAVPTVWVNSVAPGGVVPPIPPAGGDIWTLLDGRAGAPTGTIQFPTLLNGYAPSTGRVRTGGTSLAAIAGGNWQPPWMVAGIDYYVGINRSLYPTDGSLKNPYGSGSLPAGVVQDDVNHRFGVNNSGTVLDGWDFSLTGAGGAGYDVELRADNITITNCKFAFGGTAAAAINSASNAPTNVTIHNCQFDGGSGGDNWDPACIVLLSMAGVVDIQYNYCVQNSWDWVDVGNNIAFSNNISNFIMKYNLVRGLGSDVGTHPDMVQNVGNCNLQNGTIQFNTFYWQQPPSVQGNWGLGWVAETNGIIKNQNIQYNTVLYTGAVGANPQTSSMIMSLSTGTTLDSVVQNNNYIDPSAVSGTVYWGTPSSGFGTNNTAAPNWDMPNKVSIPSPF